MLRDDQYQAGLELRRAMFGPAGSDQQLDAVTDLNDKLQEFVTRQCFGDIWQRDDLSTRDRSLLTVGMLLALGRSHEIGIHMRGGLANGLTITELREAVLQSILYCGLPAAMEGNRILTEIAAEQDAR